MHKSEKAKITNVAPKRTRAMAKFINPFTDVGFKRIFGQEITKTC